MKKGALSQMQLAALVWTGVLAPAAEVQALQLTG